jgi:hypothetical protein
MNNRIINVGIEENLDVLVRGNSFNEFYKMQLIHLGYRGMEIY